MLDGITNTKFNLRAILMWTINDFPAYGNLAGYTTKGKFACPICGPDTCSLWLPCSTKTVYMRHRRFLPQNHIWRNHTKQFDGNKESGRYPRPLSGNEISKSLNNITNDWGKAKIGITGKKRKIHQHQKDESLKMWKKKSIFFELPYWEVSTF